MKNHYYCVKLKHNQRLSSPLESLIYESVPEDHLVVLEAIVGTSRSLMQKNVGDGWYSVKEIEKGVMAMIEKGFIREVFGPKLEKFLQAV